MIDLYPFTFEPIFKDRLWGGNQLHTLFGKNIPNSQIGESWEISSLPENESVIENGIFKGKTLNEIISIYPNEIMGESVVSQYGTQFPLLIKLLDAQQDLSIQLHPNDELAQKRHQSFGKTEMWYVVDAQKDARIIVGFKKESNQKEYLQHLSENKILELLDEIPVQKGDIFMIETGTIHTIGAGIVIAEIQQTSDVTYRIYDWERKDAKGNTRELHTELSLDAINYKTTSCKKNYSNNINTLNTAVNSKYFTTSVLNLLGNYNFSTNKIFVILMCIEGFFELTYNDKNTYSYKKGDSILLPANLGEIKIKGNAIILHITI
ncbi:MAG: type I phosphomannose isomerase catalytic subunit [Flavobacterium sp.]